MHLFEILSSLSNNKILVHVSQIKLEDIMLSRTNRSTDMMNSIEQLHSRRLAAKEGKMRKETQKGQEIQYRNMKSCSTEIHMDMTILHCAHNKS